MELRQQDLKGILELALQGVWQQQIPRVRAKHRLAINSLLAQDSHLSEKTEKEFFNLIMQDRNKGIRKILRESDAATIAFAIRDAIN